MQHVLAAAFIQSPWRMLHVRAFERVRCARAGVSLISLGPFNLPVSGTRPLKNAAPSVSLMLRTSASSFQQQLPIKA